MYHPASALTLVTNAVILKKTRKSAMLSQLPLGHSLTCQYLRYSFGVQA